MAETAAPAPGAALPTAARRVTSRWISGLSRTSLALVLFVFITFIHLVGLGTFTHGFLLTRLTIPEVAPVYDATNLPPVQATHSKAIVLIIDALRTDFITPFPPSPASPHHHNVLTLPAELTSKHPERSLIFDSFSDPPTTTMQRIKGITTGSLPTFIDAGANFASTAIEEDSLISQATAANRSIVFMGDDTWVNLFPSSFKHAHPYDSFNVEDLHTVDNGVIEHLFPYMTQGGWDVLIGHFLGVDHVGHRVGPDRDTMREKLEQMDAVLRKVVDQMDDETLLVVLGDHGMNAKGDHGGDSQLETSAGLWMYSKQTPINWSAGSATYAEQIADRELRKINQIDLVPTLALMLGLPIPFNNLGSIIPEVFTDEPETFAAAAGANTAQIERYINAYGNREVLAKFAECRRDFADALSSEVPVLMADADLKTNAIVLDSLRELWAQFSMTHIALGVLLLALGVAATVSLYLGVRNGGPRWDSYVRMALDTAITAGAGVGSVVGTVAGVYTREPFVAIQTFFGVAVGVASAVLAAPLFVGGTWRSVSWNLSQAIGPLILILHAVSFASNSFVMWEDRVVTFLLVSLALFHVSRALTAPTATMRLRILGFGMLIALLARTMSLSTVCREEQQPYCTVTFYEGNASNPAWSVYALLPFVLMLFPRVVAVVLSWSKSYSGPAPVFIAVIWRIVILLNAMYWTLEWMETWDGLNPDRIPLVQWLRPWFARLSLSAIFGLMPYIWASSGLCIDIERESDQTGEREDEVVVLGFGNAYGANYFLFVLMGFALVQLVLPPVAQYVLGAMIVAVLAHLEMVDTQRDAVLLQSNFANAAATGAGPGAFEPARGDALVRPSFTDAVPLALLGLLAFFGTGHQAVLASIQWKAAFVGFETVTYPWSPALVVLNTWGPIALAALCVPLLAIWNVSPRPQGSVPVLGHVVQMALAFITYFAGITLASAVTAAWLRRHLMVWKVFAPRFMLAGVTLLVVDIAILVALGFGLRITTWKVWKTFKAMSI